VLKQEQYALINVATGTLHVLFGTSKKQAVIGLGQKANIVLPILELHFHFGLT